jgi:hypothetical protein
MNLFNSIRRNLAVGFALTLALVANSPVIAGSPITDLGPVSTATSVSWLEARIEP